MKHGSSYESLNAAVRAAIAATMMYYQVDGENKRFVKILEDAIKDVKEGRQVSAAATIDKTYWDK